MRRTDALADTFRSVAAPRSAYVLAVLLPAAAVLVTVAVSRLLGGDVGVPLLSLGVFLTALAGGFVPGVLATVVAAAFEVAREALTAGTPGGPAAVETPRIILFVGAGLLVSWASGLVLRARARAELERSHEGGARVLAEAEASRAAALARLSAGFSRALTTQQVAQVLGDWGRTALGALGAVFLLSPDGLRLTEPAGGVGRATAGARPADIPIHAASPVAEVARTGKAAIVEDAASFRSRFPESAPDANAQAVAVVPLEAKGQRIGVVRWAFPQPRTFTTADAEFMGTIGDLAAQSLDRSLSYEAELSSRQQAEASRQRLDLLADAGRILGASLDYETTLEALVRLALPVLGDYAIVDLVENEGIRRIVVTASAVQAAPARVLQNHPVDLESANPVAEAIRSGRTLIVDVNEDVLQHIAQATEHRDAVRTMGIRRAMVVAIRLRDRSIGSLLFASADPDRQYESTDIAVAEVLAQRAAKAIDNGRMHREIQRLAEHEQLRAAELESVISAIGEGIVVCGPDGAVRVHERGGGAHSRRTDRGPRGPALAAGPHGGALPPPGVSLGPVECQLVQRRSAWVELTAYAVARDHEVGQRRRDRLRDARRDRVPAGPASARGVPEPALPRAADAGHHHLRRRERARASRARPWSRRRARRSSATWSASRTGSTGWSRISWCWHASTRASTSRATPTSSSTSSRRWWRTSGRAGRTSNSGSRPRATCRPSTVTKPASSRSCATCSRTRRSTGRRLGGAGARRTRSGDGATVRVLDEGVGIRRARPRTSSIRSTGRRAPPCLPAAPASACTSAAVSSMPWAAGSGRGRGLAAEASSRFWLPRYMGAHGRADRAGVSRTRQTPDSSPRATPPQPGLERVMQDKGPSRADRP